MGARVSSAFKFFRMADRLTPDFLLSGDIVRKLDGPKLPTIRRMILGRVSVCRGPNPRYLKSRI